MNANTLNAAMVAALSELTNLTKDKTNPHFKSKFTSLDAILDSSRPVLARHGLALSQEPLFEGGMAGVVTRILHVGGECRESKLLLPLRDQTAQGVGSCLTYSRRYSAAAVLGIASDEDEDGHAASSPPRQRPTTAPSPFRRVETREEVKAAEVGVQATKKVTSPSSAGAVKNERFDESTNADLEKLFALMDKDEIDESVVLAFVNRKGANKGGAEYVADLPKNVIKRLVSVWKEIAGKEAA